MSSTINPDELPELDLASIDDELRKEEKYGGRPLESAALGAAESATIGLSTPVLKSLGVSSERLREVPAREPEANIAGQVAGIVAPALVSGGSSLAAKGASAGLKGVSAVGTAAETAARSLAPNLGPKSAQLLGSVARGAGEGAVVGVGQAISDAALNDKELVGEAILQSAGTGALTGGAFGVVFGAAQATLPGIGAKAKKLGENIKKISKQGMAPITDPIEVSMRTVTGTDAARGRLKRELGNAAEDLPTYLKQDLQLNRLSTPVDLERANLQAVKRTGKEIGDVVQQLDDAIAKSGTGLTNAKAYQPLLDEVNDVIKKLSIDTNANRAQIRIAQRYRDTIISKGASETPFSFKALDDLRKNSYGDKGWSGGTKLESFEGELAGSLYGKARQVLDDAADYVTPLHGDLAARLKNLNKRYFIGSKLIKPLEATATRQSSFTTPVKWAIDTASRVGRNSAVLSDAAQKTAALQQKVESGISKFFLKGIKPGKIPTGGIQAIVTTGFAINSKTEKPPKNRNEAFANISANVQELKNDPDKLIELMARSTARISAADPALALAMQTNLVSAVNFLEAKLPKPAVQAGLYNRPYQPSSMELSKYNRYVQVVESPLSVIDELERGTLTREHVEALQAVYPAIYKQVQQLAIDKVAETPDLPYAKKVQLGILLDVPADSSLSYESVLMLQMSIAGSQQPETPQGSASGEVRGPGMDDVDIAGRAETGVEAVQNDEP